MALHGATAQILLTSAPSLNIVNQELQNSGDATTFRGSVANAATRYWDRTASFVFETSTNGSVWTPTPATAVRYINGQVTFASPVGGTAQARVASGKYFPYSMVAQALSWSADLSRDEHDDTVMTTTTSPIRWRTFKPGLTSGTFSLATWHFDDTYLDLITSTTPLIAGLVINAATGSRLDAEVFLTSDGLSVAVGELITEDLEFRVNGAVYFTP